MSKRIFIAAALAVLIARTCAAGEFKPDKNTLFLAHYNTGMAPDVSRASGAAEGFVAITSGGGGYFGEALIAKDGICTSPEGIEMAYKAPKYKAPGNFNPSAGTIELWVQMLDSWDDILANKATADIGNRDLISFYEWRGGQQFSYARITLDYNKWEVPAKKLSFLETTRVQTGATLPQADGKEWSEVYGRRFHLDYDTAGWKKGEWHHIAATWDAAKNERALFIDGVKTSSGESKLDDKSFMARAADMVIGGVYWQAQRLGVLIDEVRISDNVRYKDDFKVEKK